MKWNNVIKIIYKNGLNVKVEVDEHKQIKIVQSILIFWRLAHKRFNTFIMKWYQLGIEWSALKI